MGTESSKAEPAADADSEAQEGEGQEGQATAAEKGVPAGATAAAPDRSQQAQKQEGDPPSSASDISPSTQHDTLSQQGDGQVSTHPTQVHSGSTHKTDNAQCDPEQNNKSLSGHSGEQKDFNDSYDVLSLNSSQQEQGAEGLNTSTSSTHSLTSALKQGLSLAGFTLFSGKTDIKMEGHKSEEQLTNDKDVLADPQVAPTNQDHDKLTGNKMPTDGGTNRDKATDIVKDSEGNVLQSDVHPLNPDSVAATVGGVTQVENSSDVNSNKLEGQVSHGLTSHNNDTAQLTTDMATLQLSNKIEVPQLTGESEFPQTAAKDLKGPVTMDTAESPRTSQAWSDSGGEDDFYDAADRSPSPDSKGVHAFVTEAEEGNKQAPEGVIPGSEHIDGGAEKQSVETVNASAANLDSMQATVQVISDVTNDQTPVQALSSVTNDQGVSNAVDLSTPVSTQNATEMSNTPDLSDPATSEEGEPKGDSIDPAGNRDDPSTGNAFDQEESKSHQSIPDNSDGSAVNKTDPAVSQFDSTAATNAVVATPYGEKEAEISSNIANSQSSDEKKSETCDSIADSQSNVKDESSVCSSNQSQSKDGIQSSSTVHNAAEPTQSKSYIAHVDSEQQQKVLNKDHCTVTQPGNIQHSNVITQTQTLNPSIPQDVADQLPSDKESGSGEDSGLKAKKSPEGTNIKNDDIIGDQGSISSVESPEGTGVKDVNMSKNSSVTGGDVIIGEENLEKHNGSLINNTNTPSVVENNNNINTPGNDMDNKMDNKVAEKMNDSSGQLDTPEAGEENSIPLPKGAYNLNFLDDPNFNPFQTKTKLGGDSNDSQQLGEGNAIGEMDAKSNQDNNDDSGGVLSESKQSVNMTCNNSETQVKTPVTCGSEMQNDEGLTEQPEQTTEAKSDLSQVSHVKSDNQQSVNSVQNEQPGQSTSNKPDNPESSSVTELEHSQVSHINSGEECQKPVQSESSKSDPLQTSDDVNTDNQQTFKSAENISDLKLDEKGTCDVKVSGNICENKDESEVQSQVEQSHSIDVSRNISQEEGSSGSSNLEAGAGSKQSVDDQGAVQVSKKDSVIQDAVLDSAEDAAMQGTVQGASSGDMRDQSGTAVTATNSPSPAESNPEDLSATCAAPDAANKQQITSAEMPSSTQSSTATDSDVNTATPISEKNPVTEKVDVTQQPAENDTNLNDNADVVNKATPKRVSSMEETVSLVKVTTAEKPDDPVTEDKESEVDSSINEDRKAVSDDKGVNDLTDRQQEMQGNLSSAVKLPDQGEPQIDSEQTDLNDVIGTVPGGHSSEPCHIDQDKTEGGGIRDAEPKESQHPEPNNTGNEHLSKESKVSDSSTIIGSTVLSNDKLNDESQTEGKSQLGSSAIITEKSVDDDVLHSVSEHKKDTQESCDNNQNNVINKYSCDNRQSDIQSKDMVLQGTGQSEENTGNNTENGIDTKDMVLNKDSPSEENTGDDTQSDIGAKDMLLNDTCSPVENTEHDEKPKMIEGTGIKKDEIGGKSEEILKDSEVNNICQ